MTAFWQSVQTAIWNVLHRPGLADVIDILIVTAIIYELLMLTRQTRSAAVMKGVVFFLAATVVSDLLGLTALHWLLMVIVNNGVIVLIVLFQPELRKALETLGRGALMKAGHAGDDGNERERIIEEITQCALDLSRRKVGALIVFERKTGLQDIIETGTAVDARISAPLLENIFEPNTPLHDGAVIIRGERVMAGACILTLTENRGVSRDLGTRHRAGLGVSETTDAIVLIVSEETGIISMAQGGRLTRHLDAKALHEMLGGIYPEQKGGLLSLLQARRRKEERAE